MNHKFQRKRLYMDYENYCKILEKDLNEKGDEIHKLEDKIKSLEEIISNASSKLEEYYQQQKNSTYFCNDSKRLICRVIENCQKIIGGVFEI